MTAVNACNTSPSDLVDSLSGCLSFYLLNATSLAKTHAIQLLSKDIKANNASLALVAETWFTSKHDSSSLCIPNYTLFRRDRVKRKGGGVCIYVHNDIKCEQLASYSDDPNIEILWVKCYFSAQVYYVACCYHPPQPKYQPQVFINSITKAIDQFTSSSTDSANEYIIICGDFNTLDCTVLENYYGLVQIVNQPTHGDNILDKVFTNRSDQFKANVYKSLVKTKHMGVFVTASTTSIAQSRTSREKVELYDLRANNVDYLRYEVACYDWSTVLFCTDIQHIYDVFLATVHMLIDKSIPVKHVSLGPRDPPYVTPLVKHLLRKRNKLRHKGRIAEADELAIRINQLITQTRSRQYSKMAEASPKDLWDAVKVTRGNRTCQSNYSACLFQDLDSANNYFASVCRDPNYCLANVTCFIDTVDNKDYEIYLHSYEVERLLYRMKPTSPGLDNIPRWFFHYCSYEIADVVAHILNVSFSSGVVPLQWRQAVVTPVPKVIKPSSLLDYRPISVTSLLSRLAEKLVVTRWLLPFIPAHTIYDQFAFRPSGSTTCAMTYLLHHVTDMLERCSFVRCLMVDFSKAFDRVDHPILLAKLHNLDIPPQAINWIISYLTGRTQILKYDGHLSAVADINTSIVQGSGIGPILYVVMESDLCTLSSANILVKYADDTNLLVPSDSDTNLCDEFANIKCWADHNRMIINLSKTKEIVFRRPNPKLVINPVPLDQVEQVQCAKLLGIFLCYTLNFDAHLANTLKICSQRTYLLKLLRDQGLPRPYLNTVFTAIVLSKIIYALPAWRGFLTEEQIGQVNAFLKRSFKYSFCDKLYRLADLADDADWVLFSRMQNKQHCLHTMLPPVKFSSIQLRAKGHPYELPRCSSELHKRTFLPRCLFKFL